MLGSNATEDLFTSAACPLYNETVYQVAERVAFFCSIMSLLATCLVLFFIILFKRWHLFGQRLVIYLTLAVLIGHITSMLVWIQQICVAVGFAAHIGGYINLNPYLLITFALLLKVFYTVNLERSDLPTILFIFVSPIIYCWIPFINNGFGQTGSFCWIRNTQDVNGTCEDFLYGIILQLVVWYVPLYIVLVAMILLYTIVTIKFCFHRKKQWTRFSQDENNKRKQALTFTVTLLSYPVIYFFANVFPFLARAYGFLHPLSPSPVLWFLSGISYPLQGTGIAIVFFLSMRNKLNFVSIRAAANGWCHKTEIREYDFRDDEMEQSSTVKYGKM